MFLNQLRWGRVVFGLVLGSSLLALGGNAAAQPKAPGTYAGDYICSVCHADKYNTYIQHGHPWMMVPTGGQTPPANLFAAVGQNLPTLPSNMTWAQIEYIAANFKDSTTGFFVDANGNRVSAGPAAATNLSKMPAQCNGCHNTNSNRFAAGGLNGTMPPIQATWSLNGIQCEECHGPGPSMHNPLKPDPNYPTVNALCRDCHSSGDGLVRTAAATAALAPVNNPSYRINFNAKVASTGAITLTANQFNNHHPEGDEYRRSPHKNQSCVICHDPHKSVWHNEGGVLTPAGVPQGNMCIQCHTERLNGAMGTLWQKGIMQCVDCHMPNVSAGGTRAAHLFRINPLPLAAAKNLVVQPSDSGSPTAYWANLDGSTSTDGDAALTLDMVCTQCHSMSSATMSALAPTIHLNPTVLTLTANGSQPLVVAKTTQTVSVNFSLLAGTKKGTNANWWVSVSGPQGQLSWNGSKWVKGTVLWKKNSPMVDVPSQNVLVSKLTLPGVYTYTVNIMPMDGSQPIAAHVQVYVTR
jgi:predicted CXXCH cytochrome family protein